MRRHIVLGAAFLAVSVVVGVVAAAVQSGRPEGSLAQARLDLGEGPPDEWLLSRVLAGSTVAPEQLRRAGDQADRLGALTEQQAPAIAKPRWRFEGPEVIGGRIVDVAVDPSSANTIYVGSASGGVWKSSDAGGSFTPIWPAKTNQAIGALEITPSGKLYAGAGEANPGGGSLSFGGKGVYVSTDRGAHWRSLGLEGSERIGRIAFDPTDEQRIFVAATGPLFTPGGERGVYRSTDGGETWTLVLAGDNATTGASDVQVDPSDPSRVYAVMWDHLRDPVSRRYGGPGSGIFRSKDGGNTWQRLAGGLPAPGPNIGRIGFGQSPSTPDRLYAIYINTAGTFDGFFTSANGGNTWTRLPDDPGLSGSQSSYGWWFARIWVDPATPNHVFVAGVPLMESTNGGTSWRSQSSVHADQHAMEWDPKSAGRVYLGNDGGVYRSQTNGTGGWSFGSVQPFTQFYTVDVGEQDPSRIVGGAQDNGCTRSYSSADPSDWNSWACGDGLESLISFENQNVVYGCSQYGSCVRSLNGGESGGSIGSTSSARRNWLTPLVFDPNDADVMYYAGNIVNRSINGGQTWTAISPDLTGGDPNPGDSYPFGTVTTVAAAKSDPMVLYAGTDDGRVWFTRNRGGSWTRSTDPDLPNRWVTRVAVDPTDADVAYVTFSGFRNGDDTPYVLRSGDGGVSWTDITGNLPQAPVNAIDAHGRLIVATDVGVFLSDDGGAKWLRLGRGLPRAPVLDIRVHEPSKTLHAATFGRGMWKVKLPRQR
jgi:photosystem II stability/assembly factor-like uncharacterized protein